MKYEKRLRFLFLRYKISNVFFHTQDLTLDGAFFAIDGVYTKGSKFISKIIEEGVSLVFTNNKTLSNGLNVFYMRDIRLALSVACDILYPCRIGNLIAVTGTNGKTSTTSYVSDMLGLLGINNICINSLGLKSNLELNSNIVNLYDGATTPNPVAFRKILHSAYVLGINYAVFEVSSHGIDQKRIGNLKVDVAAFTSFSQDHLDYHKSITKYLNTKLKLFKYNLKKDSEVIINDQISYISRIISFFQKNQIKFFCIRNNALFKVEKIISHIFYQEIYLLYKEIHYKLKINIIGKYQIDNILIALKLLLNLGISFNSLVPIMRLLKNVPARLENLSYKFLQERKIFEKNRFHIILDFAHTPEALQMSLTCLRDLMDNGGGGRLIVLFGCGGNRDSSKRKLMGEVASKFSDFIIITDDNPRFEDPASIRREIICGISENYTSFTEFDSREEGIKYAISLLRKGDIFLIAGKGHEHYQEIRGKKYSYSDTSIVEQNLRILYG